MSEFLEKRILLDHLVLSDAPALCDLDRDAEHRIRFEFPDSFVPSLEHSRAVIGRWTAERQAGTRYTFAVRDVPTAAQLVGGCELRPLGSGSANLNFWTHPSHRRRGIAAEAVRRVCMISFSQLGLRRIELVADPDNCGSLRVAARTGFAAVGHRDGRVLHILDAPG